jgi:putative inorganic carbon (HCO3(-)) transporter
MLQNALPQKLRTFWILLGTTAFGVIASAVLLQSPEAASVFYVAGVVLAMILIQPFIGIVNYLTLIYVRPMDFVPLLQGLPLVFIMGAATFGFVVINTVFNRGAFVRTPQNFMIVWLFIAAVFSHLSNNFFGGALSSAKEFLNLIFVYYLAVSLVTTEKRLRIIMWLLVVLTLYLAVTGIYQGITGIGIGGETMIRGRIRGIGIFNDPNDLCLAFLMVMPFLAYRIAARKSLGEFAVAGGSFAVLLWALLMTNSRGGMLAFLTAMGLLFMRRFGRKVGFALAFLGIAGIFAMGPSRLTDLSARGESAYGRVEAWSAGLTMFKWRPLFGVGMDRFTDYHVLVAHNSFVHTAAELGLFGLIPWVLIIFVSLRNTYQVGTRVTATRDAGIAELCNSVFFGFVGFMTALVFLSRSFNPLLFLLVGLSAAAVQIFVRRQEERYVLVTKNDWFIVVFGSIGALALLQAFLILYY